MPRTPRTRRVPNASPERWEQKGVGRRCSPLGGLQSAAHRRWCTACWTTIINFNIEHQTPTSNGLSTSVSEIFVFPLSIISPQARPVHRSPTQKYRFLCLFRLLGSIFSPSGTRFKNDFEKTWKKMRKSRFLASQNPPKIHRKCLRNRAPNKCIIFH